MTTLPNSGLVRPISKLGAAANTPNHSREFDAAIANINNHLERYDGSPMNIELAGVPAGINHQQWLAFVDGIKSIYNPLGWSVSLIDVAGVWTWHFI